MIDPISNMSTGAWSRGCSWLRLGWQDFRRDQLFWLRVCGVYLAGVAVLGIIPFAGLLVIILLTPMVYASVLLSLDLRPETRHPTEFLTRAFTSEAHVFRIVLLGIMTLGIVMLMRIVEHVPGVGSLGGLFGAAGNTISPWERWVGGAIVLVLNVALLMTLFYAPHRTVLAERDAMQAMYDSFLACWREWKAHLPYIAGIAAACLLVGICFAIDRRFGYVMGFLTGLVSIPVLILASYRSHNDTFPS